MKVLLYVLHKDVFLSAPGGGRPGAPNNNSSQPPSKGTQDPPAQADPAKPKPNKKSKDIDITKMPKVIYSWFFDF